MSSNGSHGTTTPTASPPAGVVFSSVSRSKVFFRAEADSTFSALVSPRARLRLMRP
jgi:hypothetical protein